MTLVRPKASMAKYSGLENCSAKVASGFVSATMTVAESSPPASAAISVQPSALAGWPLRAMR
jgi:hypothetical protein